MLVPDRADMIIGPRCVTNGCVRATRVDGVSLGYWVILPPECVGDWHGVFPETNLFNIGTKYADAVPLQGVLAYLECYNST